MKILEGMVFIRKIEVFTISWVIFLTFILLLLHMEPISLIIGGIFMLLNFHLLAIAGRSRSIASFMLWLVIKTPIFYGLLLFFLSRSDLVNPKAFLAGTMTLILAILTSTAISKEV